MFFYAMPNLWKYFSLILANTTIYANNLSVDAREPVSGIFLNFARTFDMVNYRNHFIKLCDSGVNLKIVEWGRFFRIHLFFSVRVNKTFSTASARSDVTQGTVIGTLLFLRFLSCKALSCSSSITSRSSLHVPNSLTRSWVYPRHGTGLWQLSLNRIKCCYLPTRQSSTTPLTFHYSSPVTTIETTHLHRTPFRTTKLEESY